MLLHFSYEPILSIRFHSHPTRLCPNLLCVNEYLLPVLGHVMKGGEVWLYLLFAWMNLEFGCNSVRLDYLVGLR